MTDLTMRPITGREELDLFNQFPYVLNDEFAGDLEAGRRRPGWMWIALRGERVVARLAWWARAKDDSPFLLDTFDVADIDDGAALIGAAAAATLPADRSWPDYLCFVPPDWRDNDGDRRTVENRMAALERCGARMFVERLRLQWSAGTTVAPSNGRLRYRPAEDRDELVGLMALALEGTLDAHSRRDLQHKTPHDVAAQQYDDEFLGYDSPRAWWQIGTTPDGEPVGFVIPARNSYPAIIAYIGVVPAHRGRGYVDDLLAEGTRILAEQGVPRIRAATDLGNVPMARAFQRAGYDNVERQINMTWS
jgi:RimJ/RimL family protein N-acetyltransferase